MHRETPFDFQETHNGLDGRNIRKISEDSGGANRIKKGQRFQ